MSIETAAPAEIRNRHRFTFLIKRLFDMAVSFLLLLLLSPLFLAVAIYIKIVSNGPAFFVQDRIGYKGRPFRIYKFRTMHPLCTESQPLLWTKAEDDRIIPGGHFLRDYGLDELPQLVNIIRGDMSIIGPRPLLVSSAALLTVRERTIFRMRPGVLSLAAVEGRRSIPMEQRIAQQVKYVEEWSLGMDFSIFLRSIAVVLLRKDAEEIK